MKCNSGSASSLHFVMAKDAEFLTRYVLTTGVSSFKSYLINSVAHLLTGKFWFFINSTHGSSIWSVAGTGFFQFCCLSLHFSGCFLSCEDAFQSHVSPFLNLWILPFAT